MTARTPGQWPVEHPVHIEPSPAATGGQHAQDLPRVEVSVPEVRLVVTVDLTGRYYCNSDVTRDLYEQTQRSAGCHTAVIRVGKDALRHSLGLGQAIASRFFLAAQAVEIHVPAGTRWTYLSSEVQHYLRAFASDHAQMLATTRAPG